MTAIVAPPTDSATGDHLPDDHVPDELAGEPAPALVATDVAVHFGGLRALAGVSLRIGVDETVGLIGGNGAGKTTLMDCISGYVDPEPGSSIQAFGEELVGLPPELRPYLGVGRSFQNARLFPGLTVTEALLVALERHRPTGILGALFQLAGARQAEREKRERVDELVVTLGLEPYCDTLVAELSTGTRRVVDLASILTQRPRLLLLDEPTAGLAQRETEAFAPVLRRVKDELGCAVLVIEHDIVLIAELCDRVYAMETGRIIAEGDPDAVRRDPAVVASYLGTDEAAIRRSGARADDQPDLRSLTRAELLTLAAERGIRGRTRMRKAELVLALLKGE